jgi:hypothetical protein
MALRKNFFAVSVVLSALALAAGYAVTGQWFGVVVAMITGPAWVLARKYPASSLPFLCLLTTMGLAVTGSLTGSPASLMIFGSASALAAWDLLILDAALAGNSPGERTRQYETKHLRSLALALGSGLLAAFLGSLLHLQVSFVMLILFIALAVFGLQRVWGYVKKMEKR